MFIVFSNCSFIVLFTDQPNPFIFSEFNKATLHFEKPAASIESGKSNLTFVPDRSASILANSNSRISDFSSAIL